MKLIYIGTNKAKFNDPETGKVIDYQKAEMRTDSGTVNFSCTEEVHNDLKELPFGTEVEVEFAFSQAGKAKITKVKK